jgi:hypothetical protein
VVGVRDGPLCGFAPYRLTTVTGPQCEWQRAAQ